MPPPRVAILSFFAALLVTIKQRANGLSYQTSLSTLLDQQLAALSPEAETVLRVCVVLGRHSTLDRLMNALDIHQMQLLGAVRELERVHLVAPASPTIRPAHWLVAEAVERSTPPISLALTHRQAATTLEADSEETDASSRLWDCAEHWILAGDDVRAAQVVRKCVARATQIGRPREAAELLLRAAELIGGKLRGELICDAIQLADTSRESDVALRGFQAARQYGVRVEFEGAELVKIAAEQFQWQEREDTKERLGAWLRGDKTVKHRLRAACCALIFADHYVDQAFAAEVFETLREVESIATGPLRLAFLECLLIYQSSFGSLEESNAIAERLVALAQDMDPAAGAEVRRLAAVGFWRFGDTAKALLSFELSFAEAERAGLARLQLTVGVALIGAYYTLGDRRTAEAWLQQVERVARGVTALEESVAYANAQIAVALIRRDSRAASEWLEHVTKLTTGPGLDESAGGTASTNCA